MRNHKEKDKNSFTHNILKMLVDHFSPVCVVINNVGEIYYIHGKTGDYFELNEGRPRNNLLDVAREGLRLGLSASLRNIADNEQGIVRKSVKVKSQQGSINVDFTMEQIQQPETLSGLILVTLTPTEHISASTVVDTTFMPDTATETTAFEHELEVARESYQTIVEELETSNEELKSTNEELQSTNVSLNDSDESLLFYKQTGAVWVIVLADSIRYSGLTRKGETRERPVQFCKQNGTSSVIERTWEHARQLASDQHIITMGLSVHQRFYRELGRRSIPGKLIYQPADHGTATAVYLALSHIMANDPSANVIILPANSSPQPVKTFTQLIGHALQQLKNDLKFTLLYVKPSACKKTTQRLSALTAVPGSSSLVY